MEASLDTRDLEAKVKDMYRHVAEEPQGKYHFELGRPLADRLGYPAEVLDRVPAGAIESFAGVGYFFDLASLGSGEQVVDLGSGSGMDVFFAAEQVGQPEAWSGSTTRRSSSRRPDVSLIKAVSDRSSSEQAGSNTCPWRRRAATALSRMA